MSRLNNQSAQQHRTFFRSNPVMNRLNKIEAVPDVDGKTAGYGRITAKTAFFLLVTIGGMMLYLVLNATMFAGLEKTIAVEYRGFHTDLAVTPLIWAGVVAIAAIISQIVAAFAPGTIPVSGTIYSACQGFLIAFVIFSLIPGYEYLGLLALAITVVVVFCMAMLYAKGVIRVTKKFFMVLLTMVAAMVGISLLTFIGSLIPLTRPFVMQIMGNFWVSIALTIFSIVLACVFLISDFATIDYVVENKMSAKYEWMAAFGLAFTILWIYVKILDLLIQIVGKSKK